METRRKIHPATRGFELGAQTYARGRPDFPQALDSWLRDSLQLGTGRTVLDLGAGTGKMTRRLVQTGAEVIAAEPVDSMLAILVRDLPAVRTLRATAQNLPLADASLDAVVCAQAFHWFATREALAEIRRVLKPGGVLGLVWNIRDETVDWIAQLTRIMAPHEGDAPRYYNGEWRTVFPARGFGELQESSFPHSHVGSPEQVIVERVASVSFIAALDAEIREQVIDEVRALIAATPTIAGRDPVAMPYLTRVYWTRAVPF